MEPKQLPHLLSLLDDDSPIARAEVGRHLESLGERLSIELARLNTPPTPAQRRLLQEALRPRSRAVLRSAWGAWLRLPEGEPSLERACALLSEYLSGYVYPTDLAMVLDDLARDFLARHRRPGAAALAEYLFRERGLAAAPDYYDPLNSDLVSVVKEGRGIPLSLCLIYQFTGTRLGLDISGCDFPGHFLARVREAGREYLVDCFNAGVEVDPKVVASAGENSPWSVQEALHVPARPRAVAGRMLRNLARAFEEKGRPEDLALAAELGVALERDDLARSAQGGASAPPRGPVLRTGQVVRCPGLGLRGLVVDFDLSCKAPGIRRRRADADQPWYHLLVDGGEAVAYLPEDALEAETPAGEVRHTLLREYFDLGQDGRYWRNLRAWP